MGAYPRLAETALPWVLCRNKECSTPYTGRTRALGLDVCILTTQKTLFSYRTGQGGSQAVNIASTILGLRFDT